MNEPIVTFDTLSVDPNWQGLDSASRNADDTPPVIARFPRLPEGRRPAKQSEVEFEESPARVHEDRTLRIDAAENESNTEPAPALSIVSETEEAYSSWLLDLESLLAMNSRWIVLLALLAALGLTMLLLQGGGEVKTPPDIVPMTVSEEAAPAFMATNESNALPEAPVEGLAANSEESPAAYFAAGPVTTPSTAPRAELAGVIEPATPVEKNNHLETAQKPVATGYPRTANAEALWLPSNNETELR